MEDFLIKFKGKRLKRFECETAVFVEFEDGSSFVINNRVNVQGLHLDQPKEGQKLLAVRRECNLLNIKFETFELTFRDDIPDNFDPEMLIIMYEDGRLFVHTGD